MLETDVVLKVTNITKVFKSQGMPVVNNVSFTVLPGEIFGLVGAENSGKTTILRMITGLTKATSGDIVIDDHNIESDLTDALKVTGALISSPAFYPYLSGFENLKILASYFDDVSNNQINDAAKYVGLSKTLHTKVSKYSIGMKQRLGIAQALINKPKLLLLDEPTIGLDPSAVKELRNLLLSLARKLNMAILISSRSESDVKDLCDTIAVLDNGKIIKQTSTTKIKQAIKNDQSVTLTVDYPAYVYKIIKNQYSLNPEISGKTVSFKTSEDIIASIIAKLNSLNVSIFDMASTLRGIKELIK